MTSGVQSHRFLHSFCLNPQIKFETQFKNEKIILVLRAHPLTQIPWVFNAFIFLFILFFANFFLPAYFSGRQTFFINFFTFSAILSYIWLNFFNWFFNVGIVTDKRIIDIDLSSIVYKEVTEANLDKVQDVTSKSGGFFSTFFNYGNIFVQTAAEQANIEFLDVPDPSEAVKIINNLVG